MFHHYAITPDCIDLSKQPGVEHPIDSVEHSLLAIEKNGILANYHDGEWMRDILVALSNLSKKDPNVTQSVSDVQSLLAKLGQQNQIYKHQKIQESNSNQDLKWLVRASDLWANRQSADLSLILSTELYLDDLQGENIKGPFEDIRCARKANGKLHELEVSAGMISQTQLDFQNLVEPLLCCSQKLWLIDKFMNPIKPRFFNTIQACSEQLSRHVPTNEKTKSGGGKIEIHTSNLSLPEDDQSLPENEKKGLKEKIEEAKRIWANKLQGLADKSRHEYAVYFWKNWDDGPRPHARYLITERLGYGIEAGLDFGSPTNPPSTADWYIIDYQMKQKLLTEQFGLKEPGDRSRDSQYYEFLDKVCITPKQ